MAVTLFDEIQTGDELHVAIVSSRLAAETVIEHHYLHRRPPISYAYGLFRGIRLLGVCTFGIPPSRHLQISVCPQSPDQVIELNRLWVDDECPRNTESWFVSRCLQQLPPHIVVSYADTNEGHAGFIYRALSWHYAGWTDMDRKTPRLDYIPINGGHSRAAMRTGYTTTVRRKPKIKYWTTTGSKTQRHALRRKCAWPSLSWAEIPPPTN